ncbi:MAG: hypothetical protein ACJ72R_16195 [Nitrososphaeraceae archaeon]
MLSAQAALIVGSLVTTIPLIQYNTNPMMYPLSLEIDIEFIKVDYMEFRFQYRVLLKR